MDGFAGGGVDLADADLVVGTSAGSLVGAHVALGLKPADALETVAAFGAMLDAAGMEYRSGALLDAMEKAAASETPEEGRRWSGTGRPALVALLYTFPGYIPQGAERMV